MSKLLRLFIPEKESLTARLQNTSVMPLLSQILSKLLNRPKNRSKNRAKMDNRHSVGGSRSLEDGRKLKRLQDSRFHNRRLYDEDSGSKSRSALPKFPKQKKNRLSRSEPFGRDSSDSSGVEEEKASASNWVKDIVSRRHDKEGRKGSFDYGKSTMSSVQMLARWGSDRSISSESPDKETERRKNKPENRRFRSDLQFNLQDACHESNMALIVKKYELCYPSIARGVEVVYTSDKLEVENWLKARIKDCSVSAIGCDIEWKPQIVSKKNGGTENPTAVLQLGTEKSCLVLHIYHMIKLPKLLKRILKDTKITKVGSGIENDGFKLERDRGLVLKGLADIQLMAKANYPSMLKTGLQALADRFLGIKLDKTAAFSDWEMFPLQDRQIEYAALDAWVALKIFNEMKCNM